MAYYDDDRGSKRQGGRGGRTREGEYQETSYYSSRGGHDDRDVRQNSLVRRRRDDSVSSTEEIDREFAPGSGYVKETTIRKHGTRPARARSFNGRDRYIDDYDDPPSYAPSRRGVDDYAVSRRSTHHYSSRGDRRSRRYHSDSDSSPSRSPRRRRERRKSTAEQALGALGLGGVAGALLGKRDDRSRSRDRGTRRDRDYSSDRSRSRRSRSRGGRDRARSKSKGREKIIQSLKAAALAGATEAFRARKEPGGWTGAKGKRILTAAVGAAGVDGLITGTGSGDPEKHSTRHIIESALGGLAAGHFINGPRSQSRGRGRSPSQSRGGAADLISGGILAAGAKKLYDRQSKSRGRHESSSDSYDSRGPHTKERKRSKSITDYARNGLASLGIGGGAGKADDRRGSRGLEEDDEYYRQRYDEQDGYPDSREVGQPLPSAVNGGAHVRDGYDYGPHHTGDPDTDSDSDLGSSSGEEKERKKGTGKQLLTAGLATIATIHAVHTVWQSAEKHEEREKELRKGEISKAEAKKQRNRGYLQDAASVGIAALGIKGAMSEWMEAKEHREEHRAKKEKFMRHRAKRAARREKQLMLARQYQQSGFSGSMPNLSTTGGGYYQQPQPGGAPYSAVPRMGPTYYDDNPFAVTAGPLPPSGYMQTPQGWEGRQQP
jgi:hypothetical protein